MQLRGIEPAMWEEFVLAVREYAAALTMDMLKHDHTTLLRAQGMALAANEIATTLQQAPQLYEKLKERRHGR